MRGLAELAKEKTARPFRERRENKALKRERINNALDWYAGFQQEEVPRYQIGVRVGSAELPERERLIYYGTYKELERMEGEGLLTSREEPTPRFHTRKVFYQRVPQGQVKDAANS